MLTILSTGALPLDYTAQIAFVSIDSFPIMAIPFFIAAGVFMGAGSLSERLLGVADKLVGSLPGGLALASVMTCMFFSAISGLGPATVAAIGVIITPVLLPLATSIGINPIHFGVIMVVGLALGFITPPVGVNLFVASSIAKVGIEKIAKAAFPFLLMMIAVLLLITFVPSISLFLL